MFDPIRDIVVPTDFSDCAEAAVARAVALAKLDDAAVHLLHAVGMPIVSGSFEVSVPGAIWEGLRRGAEERLEETRKAVEAAGLATVTAEVSDGMDPARATQRAVEAHDADLVVMGTHGYGGLKRAVLGSVAERTIRSATCPVLAVKGEAAAAAGSFASLLVALDFSAHSDLALDAAASLASRFGAALHVVHALELPQAYVPYAWSAALGVELDQSIRDAADEQLAAVEERLKQAGLSPTTHRPAGRAREVIPAVAEEIGCDLIVMGTRGNTGLSHLLLGSVAERTLREADCSVLTVTAKQAE
jgi:nucleotide-binding universal stress UspA family protein